MHHLDMCLGAFNALVREGLLTYKMLKVLTDEEVEHNTVDKQVCDMLAIRL